MSAYFRRWWQRDNGDAFCRILLYIGRASTVYTTRFGDPCTREFCDTCGTHLITRSPRMKDAVLIKVGSIDDQTVYGMPGAIVYTSEKQAYHCLPEGVPTFEKFPAPWPVE